MESNKLLKDLLDFMATQHFQGASWCGDTLGFWNKDGVDYERQEFVLGSDTERIWRNLEVGFIGLPQFLLTLASGLEIHEN